MLAATLDVLAENGPAGFTIAEVAKRAGVHETSVYRRWGTRERLALEAMSELSTELLPVPNTGSLAEDLVELGTALAEYVRSPLGEALTRSMAVSDDDEEVAGYRARFWDARYAECCVIVDRAIERQEVPVGTSGRLLLEIFVAPIHFRLLLSREPVTDAFLEVLAAAAVSGSTGLGR